MDYFLPISIGLMQVFFFSKLADNLFDNKNTQNCFELEVNQNNKEYKKCLEKNQEEMNKTNSKKFIFMLTIATIIFIIISQIQTTDNVKFGTGFGALIMIYYALIMQWSQMNETVKLTVLGSSLCILLYGSSKANTL